MADVRLRDLNPAVFNYEVNIAGSVGIGTTGPTAKLQVVYAGGAPTGFKVTSSGNRSKLLVSDNDTSAYFIAEDGYISIGGYDDLDTGNLNINASTGKVGIGTTSPGAPLAFGGSGGIWVNNDTSNPFGMDTVASKLRLFSGNQGTVSYQMQFGGMTSGTFVSYMTIGDGSANRGNVGIGTTSPGSKFVVVGNSDAGDSDARIDIIDNDSTTGSKVPAISFRAGLSTQIYQIRANDSLGLTFRNSSDATKIVFDDDGKVGIGTTAPTHKLHLVNSDTQAKPTQLLIENTADGGAGIQFKNTDFASSLWQLFIADDSSGLKIGRDGSDYLTVKDGGKVGIGTDSPTETLHVAGNLKVTGSIEVGVASLALGTGFIAAYSVAAAPSGWLACNGSVVSRTTYSDLFALIGTTYGAGNGSSTFNVPDLRGRTLIGINGLAAGSFTANLGTLDNVGGIGGAQNHTLTTAELPPHTHTQRGQSACGHDNCNGGWAANIYEHRASSNARLVIDNIDSTGGGGSHNTVQPSLAISYLIKT